MIGGRLWAAAALLLALPAVGATPAGLDGHIVAAAPTVSATGATVGTGGGYLVDVVVADVDGTVTFTNTDLREHDVVSRASGPSTNPWCSRYPADACPLFATPLIGGDPLSGPAHATVEGIHQLVPRGAYPFYCSIHPGMEGTLLAI